MLTAVPTVVAAVSGCAMGGLLPGGWPSKVAETVTLRTLWVLVNPPVAAPKPTWAKFEPPRNWVAMSPVRRSHGLAIEGVAHSLRCRVPGDNDGMPRAVLDIGQGHPRGGEGAGGAAEIGVIAGDFAEGRRC